MLHELIQSGKYAIEALLCVIKEKDQSINMHGVPVGKVLMHYSELGINKTAYGDLFLEALPPSIDR